MGGVGILKSGGEERFPPVQFRSRSLHCSWELFWNVVDRDLEMLLELCLGDYYRRLGGFIEFLPGQMDGIVPHFYLHPTMGMATSR